MNRSQGWQEEFAQKLKDTPHHYKVQIPKELNGLSDDELLKTIVLVKELEQKWKWDILLRCRIAFFAVWIHIFLGMCLLLFGSLNLIFGLILLVGGIGMIICGLGILGGGIMIFIGFSANPDFVVGGIALGIAAFLILFVASVIQKTGQTGWDFATEKLNLILEHHLKGIDTIIYHKERRFFFYCLVTIASIIGLFHYFGLHIATNEDLRLQFFGILGILWLIGKVIVRVPKHQKRIAKETQQSTVE